MKYNGNMGVWAVKLVCDDLIFGPGLNCLTKKRNRHNITSTKGIANN